MVILVRDEAHEESTHSFMNEKRAEIKSRPFFYF